MAATPVKPLPSRGRLIDLGGDGGVVTPSRDGGDVNGDFALVIDFEKHTPDPSRVFRAAQALIEAFEDFDRDLAAAIDTKIEPTLFLEDIEVGSIRIWLRERLKETDDEDIRKLDWKPTVGRYLVKAKYVILDLLNRSAEITDRKPIEDTSLELTKLAAATEVLPLPAYGEVSPVTVVKHLEALSAAKSPLGPGDKLMLIAEGEPSVTIDLNTRILPGTLEELLVREAIDNHVTLILRVKKPDYLGRSRWEFHHEGHTIEAKIEQLNWLHEFQTRQIDVRPGDAIRARVRHTVQYGFDNSVVSSTYAIEHVYEVIPAPTQTGFEWDDHGQ